MMTSGDHRVSRAVMTVHCGGCGCERAYFPQSIRHMQMTPRCSECGWRQWLDDLNFPVYFGAPDRPRSERGKEEAAE